MAKILSTYLDTDPKNQPPGTARHIRNMINSKSYSDLVNEYGFDFLMQFDKQVCGIIKLTEDKALIFLAPDEIGLYDVTTQTYTQVYVNSSLQLSTDYPVSGQFHKNLNDEFVIFFTDDFNVPKLINVTFLQKNPTTDIRATYFFPQFSAGQYPLFTITSLDNGGELQSGAYYFAIRYFSPAGATTNWSYLSNSAYIIDDNTTTNANINQIDGCAEGTQTNKALNISIQSGYTSDIYPLYELAVVKEIGGVVTAELINEGTVQPTIFYNFTGSGQYSTLLFDEIIIKTPYYKTIKAHTQLDNVLYPMNLTTAIDYQLQDIANNSFINYTIDYTNIVSLVPTFTTGGNVIEKSTKISQKRAFLPGEVYAFYMHFVYANGSISKGYHIPGRIPVTGDKTLLTNGADTGLANNTYQNYQVYDTCNVTGATTNMGYWENRNEPYPTIKYSSGPLDGQFVFPQDTNVRHHRFPSLQYLKSIVYTNDTSFGCQNLPVLGITVNNVNIPLDAQGDITGYFVSFAKREIGNQTFISQSVLQSTSIVCGMDSGVPDQFIQPPIYAPTSGAWNIHLLNDRSNYNGHTFHGSKAQNYTYCKFHGFETIQLKPSIYPVFVRNEYVIKRVIEERTNIVQVNGGTLQVYSVTADYTDYSGAFQPSSIRIPTRNNNDRQDGHGNPLDDRIKTIQYSQYIPFDSTIPFPNGENFVNEGSESSFLMRFDFSKCTPFSYSYFDATGVSGPNNRVSGTTNGGSNLYSIEANEVDPSDGTIRTPTEETYISTLCTLPSDLYSAFYEQILCRATDTYASPATGNINAYYYGDGFLNDYSFMSTAYDTAAFMAGTTARGVIHGDVRSIHRFPCFSNLNSNYRFEGNNAPNTSYYPKSAIGIMRDLRTDGMFEPYKEINLWGYNNDYNAINDKDGYFSVNPFIEYTDKFPYRILKGQVAQEGGNNLDGWTVFLANNYYEMPRNRGEIINAETFQDILFIHQRYSLFKTRAKAELDTTIGKVTLGSQDIFALAPLEVISSDTGYLGNQNQHGSIMCKEGYLFTDVEKGEIYLATGADVKKISAEGFTNYYKDLLTPNKAYLTQDNPFKAQGITIGYDERFERVLCTFQIVITDPVTGVRTNKSVTWSYSFLPLQGKVSGWISNHDYIPDFLFSTRNSLLSIKDNALWIHNNPLKRGKYYDQNLTIHPSFVVAVNNVEPEAAKLYQSIAFDTTLKSPTDGSLSRNLTFDSAVIADSYQVSGNISIVAFSNMSNPYNTRKIKNKWRFNNFRDLNNGASVVRFFDELYNDSFSSFINSNKSYIDKILFSDSYLLVKLVYNNTNVDVSSNQLEFILHDIDVDGYKILR